MKKAFSFIEVIISVVILSFMGVAILNFNSFNKTGMFSNIEKQNTLLVSNPLLYLDTELENGKTYKLYDLVNFQNLSSEDAEFLKSVELEANKEFNEKLFLYNDGKVDYFLEYSDVSIKYKDHKPISYLNIERYN